MLGEVESARKVGDSRLKWEKRAMESRLDAAIDRLPAVRNRLNELIDLHATATDVSDSCGRKVVLHVRIEIDRELAADVGKHDAIIPIVAADVSDHVRSAIKEKKAVEISSLLVEALGLEEGA